MTSSDQITPAFGPHDYPDIADTLNYILKDMFICIIKEQCSDHEESQ
jgi:hypothetical protein